MSQWIGIIFDGILILVIGVGIVQAIRLIAQLRDLRASRVEMERFVREFNAAVMRADAGIKSLRSAARESGDDLEKLVEKAVMVRDELHFIVESADGLAERLSVTATKVMHTDQAAEAESAAKTKQTAPVDLLGGASQKTQPETAPPPSRAEKELLQALQKMK